MTQVDLHRLIAQCKLAVLSTLTETGAPQSALVGIAVTPNLIARCRCSFVIGWPGYQTVQYEAKPRNFKGGSCNAAKRCTSKHCPMVQLASRGPESCISW
jgi:hypothetical protein